MADFGAGSCLNFLSLIEFLSERALDRGRAKSPDITLTQSTTLLIFAKCIENIH
jgi:hypothetical protein